MSESTHRIQLLEKKDCRNQGFIGIVALIIAFLSTILQGCDPPPPPKPIGERVKITLLSFRIIDGADYGGEGQIFGEFSIGGEKIWHKSESEKIEVGADTIVQIVGGQRTIDYLYADGGEIRISGSLSDFDDTTDHDAVGAWDFSIPLSYKGSTSKQSNPEGSGKSELFYRVEFGSYIYPKE